MQAHQGRFGFRLVVLLWGLLTLGFGLVMWNDLQMIGWPDGSITPFDADTRSLRTVLVFAVLAQALFFLVLTAFGRRARAVRPMLILALAALTTVLPLAILDNCAQAPGCAAAYQAIWNKPFDTGAGG